MRRLLATLAFAGAASAADAPPRPPVEDTYVFAPRQVAGYRVIETMNYAERGQLLAGVGLKYRDALQPALSTDLFVYPAGDDQSLETAERTFRASVELAARRKLYSDVRWGEATDYTLAGRDGAAWTGRMIPMQVHRDDTDVASRTYLFHHGLYDYKLRIDLPAAQAGDLPAAADALVRAVLPTVQVVSTGGCGHDTTITVLKESEPMPDGYVDGVSPDGFGIALRESELGKNEQQIQADAQDGKGLVGLTLLAASRQVAHGCTSAPFTPPVDSATTAVLKIHYPATFWKTGSDKR